MSYYKLLWQENERGEAEIFRVFGETGIVRIPAVINERKVAGIGANCFAKSAMGEKKDITQTVVKCCLHNEKILDWEEVENLPDSVYMQELCGENVEQLFISSESIHVGRLAFYNCSNLEEIHFVSGVDELGGDAFMNCTKLTRFTFQKNPQECIGLSQILHQRTEDVELLFYENGQVVGSFFYPEYTESYHEIGPAHIFELLVEGEGFRARQCFSEGKLDAKAYDEVFPKACVEEEGKTLCHMAAGRLRYPFALGKKAEEDYFKYLKHNQEIFAEYLCKRGSIEDFVFFIENHCMTEQTLNDCIAIMGRVEEVKKTAELLSLKSRYFERKSEEYSFDEW